MAEEEKKEAPKTSGTPKPSKHKKTWCCLAAFLVFLFVLSFSPVIRSMFSASSDMLVPIFSPSAQPSAAIATTKPPTSRATLANYPEPSPCQTMPMTSVTPLDVSSASPGLNKDVAEHFYAIYGYTEMDLRKQMQQCGPKSEGEPYDAYTSWNVSWKYNYRNVSGGCALKDVTVGVRVGLFYPKWDAPASFQDGLLEKWQAYMANLRTHENGHGQNGLDAANEVLSQLSSQASATTCDTAASTANSAGYNIVAKYGQIDKDYDATTNHGATQGAVFP